MAKILDYIISIDFITSCVIFVAAVAICIFLGKTKKKMTKKVVDLKDPKIILTRRIIIAGQIAVIILAFIIICQINGINLISLVAGFGIAGAVVGLAFQDYLKDVIMGAHILSDRFFSVGDCVQINGKEGIVIGFSPTTTKIESLADRSVFTICNRNIGEVTKLNGIILLDIPLSYEEDAIRIHDLLNKACKKITDLKEVKKCEFLGTQDFSDSSVLYRLSVHYNGSKRYIVRRAVLFELQKIFKEENIVIPFNQLDVHLNSV